MIDPRQVLIERVASIQSKPVLGLLFNELQSTPSSTFSRNTNGVYFNLSKYSDAFIQRILGILDDIDSHQAQYDKLSCELEMLRSIVSRKPMTDKERELPHPSKFATTSITASNDNDAPIQNQADEIGDHNGQSIHLRGTMMMPSTKKPNYKGVYGRLDKILRRRKSSQNKAIRRVSQRRMDDPEGDPEGEGGAADGPDEEEDVSEPLHDENDEIGGDEDDEEEEPTQGDEEIGGEDEDIGDDLVENNDYPGGEEENEDDDEEEEEEDDEIVAMAAALTLEQKNADIIAQFTFDSISSRSKPLGPLMERDEEEEGEEM